MFRRYADATPWRVVEARARAAGISETLARDASCAVLLGRRVGAAFGLDGVPFFEWQHGGVVPLVVLPHPSGRNLLMNENPVRERVGEVLREALSVCAPT